jgi:hypothetical protein
MDENIALVAGKNYYFKMAVWDEQHTYALQIQELQVHTTLRSVPESTAKKEAPACWFRKPLVLKIDTYDQQPEKQETKPVLKTQPDTARGCVKSRIQSF